jgi:segregation and condensation protein B
MTDEPNDIQASDEDELINDEDLMEEISSLQEQGILEEPAEDEDFSDDDLVDADEKTAEEDDFADGMDVTVESVIEAVLFASDEPLSDQRLVNIVDTGSVKQIRECIENLNKKYDNGNFAFRIEQIAGGYQMMTLGSYNIWLKKLLRARTDTKLSQAALETLAIISYKQPIIRADIEAIRGVAAGEMIRSLMYKGLVKIVGRAEVLGRPMLYGTTKKFLDSFGLNTLKDLPKIEELKKPML